VTTALLQPEIEPDFIVSGDLTPDVTGNYYYVAEFDEHPCYQGGALNWYLAYNNSIGFWVISEEPGDVGIIWPCWIHSQQFSDPPGTYNPTNGAEGIATVSEPM
jgi:hypothetical protein